MDLKGKITIITGGAVRLGVHRQLVGEGGCVGRITTCVVTRVLALMLGGVELDRGAQHGQICGQCRRARAPRASADARNRDGRDDADDHDDNHQLDKTEASNLPSSRVNP